MDESTVRRHAEEHGRAMVAGDLGRAASDLAPEAQAQARDVMRELPRSLTAADVVSVREEGEDSVVRIQYEGEGRKVTLESRWADRDGRPMIVGLAVAAS